MVGMDEKRKIVRDFREKMIKSFLGVLLLRNAKKKGDLTGYKIMMEINEKFGMLLSSGTVYGVLYGLENDGLVQSSMKDRSRVYGLTEKGEDFLNTLMNDQQCRQLLALLEKPLPGPSQVEAEKRAHESIC